MTKKIIGEALEMDLSNKSSLAPGNHTLRDMYMGFKRGIPYPNPRLLRILKGKLMNHEGGVKI